MNKDELVEKLALSDEKQDACTPTQKQIADYMATPDSDAASSLRKSNPSKFKWVCTTILYGENIAKAQVHHILDNSELLALIAKEYGWISPEREFEFLDSILHQPFFEFCLQVKELQVKERKQKLQKLLGREFNE
jgi:hypothetical protein